ncbi:MAG: DNA-directed polymerase sigma-70 factor [Myxococcales bacterium]|nr:DNA-directed polymerase sigma-70 factor [Myxococcales bacterium]
MGAVGPRHGLVFRPPGPESPEKVALGKTPRPADIPGTRGISLAEYAPVQTEQMALEFEPVLYARALRLVRSPQDAWDLVQDTFEHALRGFARFQPGTNLRVWLMTIMHHLFIDRCRRRSREPGATRIEDHEIASPEALAPEPWEAITDEQIAEALRELESPFREVYELRLFSRCSYDEIAERLTIPRSTVGTRLMRARQKLKKTLLERAAC